MNNRVRHPHGQTLTVGQRRVVLLSRLPCGLWRSETCKQRGQEDADMRERQSRQPFRSGRWLLLLVLCTAVALAGAPSYAQQKPNIILILSDDFGYGDSGPYGGGPGRGMPTPGLDRLSDEGMTFFSFYAQPSCTPGRAAVQ